MKYKIYLKYLGFFILSVVLALLSTGFVAALPGYAGNVDLVVVCLLFLLIVADLRVALIISLLAGYFMDIFSFLPFGVNLISLLLTVSCCYALLTSFFTNRSLYSLMALTAIATAINWSMFRLSDSILAPLSGLESSFDMTLSTWTNLLFRLGMNLLLCLVFFQVVNFSTNKLRPVFLFKK
ncbi:hypothetical protein HGA64_00240 [Candidatus Falkowbacteria bacterium]|nr:hypothetical protein [Candidatus Falkowbacteria bacterium]